MDNELKIIKSIIKQHPETEKELSRAKRQLARNFGIGIVSNNLLLKVYREVLRDRKSTRLNSSHIPLPRMPSSA